MQSQNHSNLDWQLKCILKSVLIIPEMTVNGYWRAEVKMHWNRSRKMLWGRHCCAVSSSRLLLAILNTPVVRTKRLYLLEGREATQQRWQPYIYVSVEVVKTEQLLLYNQDQEVICHCKPGVCLYRLTVDTGCQCEKEKKKSAQRTPLPLRSLATGLEGGGGLWFSHSSTDSSSCSWDMWPSVTLSAQSPRELWKGQNLFTHLPFREQPSKDHMPCSHLWNAGSWCFI